MPLPASVQEHEAALRGQVFHDRIFQPGFEVPFQE
jgi:hypothetical protein